MRQIVLGVLLLAAPFGRAAAEEPKSSFEQLEQQKEPTRTSVSGTIVSMSGYSLAIETSAGNRIDFELGSDSMLPTGTTTGDRVVVSYKPADTGVSHVIEVIRTAGSEPGPAVVAGNPAAAPVVTAGPPVARRGAAQVPAEPPRSHRGWFAAIGLLALGAIVAVGWVLRSRP